MPLSWFILFPLGCVLLGLACGWFGTGSFGGSRGANNRGAGLK